MPSLAYVFPQLMNLTPLLASGNSNAISLPPRSSNSLVTVHMKLTLGSLTNMQFTIVALNPDGSTFAQLIGVGTTPMGTGVIAASGNYAFTFSVAGVKQIRVAYVTTGVTTSSAAIIDATAQL